MTRHPKDPNGGRAALALFLSPALPLPAGERIVQIRKRERIFEKFGTVEVRQESAYHSVGLGLAFCKLAVEAHGGTIGVDPGAQAGSTFWFELPT